MEYAIRHGLQRFEPGAGRAQAGARLRAGDDLARLLIADPAHARHRGELCAARTARCRTASGGKWRSTCRGQGGLRGRK
ncbi:MAG: GNAT family N-acetyltransferase [Rhodocyclaceae bacterium]|nr:GNAT family N-acetyltransferase [Rhodocyclaceae bacterium]